MRRADAAHVRFRRSAGLRLAVSGLVVAAISLSGAACGSSSSSSSSSSTASSSSAGTASAAGATQASQSSSGASGLSGQPIKIFVSAPVGTVYGDYPDEFTGAQAAALAINHAGGIHGRPIQIITCNSKFDPNVTLGCGREAVGDGVTAIIDADLFDPEYLPLLAKAGIPDLAYLETPQGAVSPIVFGLNGGAYTSYPATVLALKAAGAKRLAIVRTDLAAADYFETVMEQAAKAVGLPVVGVVKYAGTTADFSPTIQQLANLHPDAVTMEAGNQQSPALISTGVQQGLKVMWANQENSLLPRVAKKLGSVGNGTILTSTYPPSSASAQFPGIKQFNDEMDALTKTGANTSVREEAGINGWLSVHAIADVAREIKGPVNSHTLLVALRAQKTPINLFGLVSWAPGSSGPAQWPRASNPYVYVHVLENGVPVVKVTKPLNVFAQTGL